MENLENIENGIGGIIRYLLVNERNNEKEYFMIKIIFEGKVKLEE